MTQRPKATSAKRQAATFCRRGDKPQATSYKLQATSYKHPDSGFRQQASSAKLI